MIQVLRGLVAIAIVVAIVGQALANADRGTFNPANFFSYFTILSNIASVWLLGRMALQPSWAKSSAVVRGAITLYMAVTGIVDALLLSGVDVGLPEPWVDMILHVGAPVFVVLDWFVFRARQRLDRKVLLQWLIFPAVYLVYSLVRGPIVDWYPYPFLDPRLESGYLGVAITSVGVLVAFVVLGSIVRWWAGRRAD
jgi:hypothetical protein